MIFYMQMRNPRLSPLSESRRARMSRISRKGLMRNGIKLRAGQKRAFLR